MHHGNILLLFLTFRCGHCKKLAPTYEKLAQVYKNDENVVIASVDADAHKSLGGRYGVTGFPTLKFFPKANKDGVAYSSGRDLPDFVTFINAEAGTQRLENGRLASTAGTVTALNKIASAFLKSDDRAALIAEAEGIVAEEGAGEFYVKYMNAINKRGDEWVAKEVERLTGLVESDNIAGDKLDQFTVRLNIISKF